MKKVFFLIILIISLFLYGCVNTNAKNLPKTKSINQPPTLINGKEDVIKCNYLIKSKDNEIIGKIYIDGKKIYLMEANSPNLQQSCQSCLTKKEGSKWVHYLPVNPNKFRGCKWIKGGYGKISKIYEIIHFPLKENLEYIVKKGGKTYSFHCKREKINLEKIFSGKVCTMQDFSGYLLAKGE